MERVKRSQAYLRKRKVMIVLPLLVIPFFTMAFWALGGGGNTNREHTDARHGLNLQLPTPNLKEDKAANKLSFYEQTDRDSTRLAEQMRNDPYFQNPGSKAYLSELEQLTQQSAEKFNRSNLFPEGQLKVSPYDKQRSPAEEKIMQRLAALNKVMKENESQKFAGEEKTRNEEYRFGSDVDRLAEMMKAMNGSEGDPEIKGLETTLDKILDIQHPQRVRERMKKAPGKNEDILYAVTNAAIRENISLLDTIKEIESESSFYGPGEPLPADQHLNAIQAVVHETQTLVNGSVIKFRLVHDAYLDGNFIPKGNFVFGIASLNGERLDVEINSIRYQQSLYPVKLRVFDIDGLPGIYIPGAITREVANQSVDNSLELMELSTVDPSLKAQATAAGIGAAKNLFRKKVKLVKVMVKAGYKVFLNDLK